MLNRAARAAKKDGIALESDVECKFRIPEVQFTKQWWLEDKNVKGKGGKGHRQAQSTGVSEDARGGEVEQDVKGCGVLPYRAIPEGRQIGFMYLNGVGSGWEELLRENRKRVVSRMLNIVTLMIFTYA